MRPARACLLLLLLTACRGQVASEDADRSSTDASQTTRPASEPLPSPAPGSSADAFAGLEQLRPHAWAGWPLENVDPIGFDGWRIDATTGQFARDHGLLFASDPGAFVLAIADGEVLDVQRNADDRIEVSVDHGRGMISHCGPLSDALVHAGLPLRRGAALGLAAGTSLRLRVTIGGVDVDPLLILRGGG